MFKELAPLVRHRAVLFTVAHVEDDKFRVNVIPKKVTDDENDALTTPVSVTGTAEDLDRELPQTLLNFVSSHLEPKNSLERAKAEMEEASRVARAEARKKGIRPAASGGSTGISSKPAAVPEAPLPARVEPPRVASLFDATPASMQASQANGAVSADGALANAESDEDEDEEILRECYGQTETVPDENDLLA